MRSFVFSVAFALSWIAALGSTVYLLGSQVLHWLKHGEWQSVGVRHGLEWLGFTPRPIEWIGLQRLIDFALDVPLWLGVFFGGLFVAGNCLALAEWHQGRDAFVRTPEGKALHDEARAERRAEWRRSLRGWLGIGAFIALWWGVLVVMHHAATLHPVFAVLIPAAAIAAFVWIVWRGRRALEGKARRPFRSPA